MLVFLLQGGYMTIVKVPPQIADLRREVLAATTVVSCPVFAPVIIGAVITTSEGYIGVQARRSGTHAVSRPSHTRTLRHAGLPYHADDERRIRSRTAPPGQTR